MLDNRWMLRLGGASMGLVILYTGLVSAQFGLFLLDRYMERRVQMQVAAIDDDAPLAACDAGVLPGIRRCQVQRALGEVLGREEAQRVVAPGDAALCARFAARDRQVPASGAACRGTDPGAWTGSACLEIFPADGQCWRCGAERPLPSDHLLWFAADCTEARALTVRMFSLDEYALGRRPTARARH